MSYQRQAEVVHLSEISAETLFGFQRQVIFHLPRGVNAISSSPVARQERGNEPAAYQTP
jgi:hypothetical protein